MRTHNHEAVCIVSETGERCDDAWQRYPVCSAVVLITSSGRLLHDYPTKLNEPWMLFMGFSVFLVHKSSCAFVRGKVYEKTVSRIGAAGNARDSECIFKEAKDTTEEGLWVSVNHRCGTSGNLYSKLIVPIISHLEGHFTSLISPWVRSLKEKTHPCEISALHTRALYLHLSDSSTWHRQTKLHSSQENVSSSALERTN